MIVTTTKAQDSQAEKNEAFADLIDRYQRRAFTHALGIVGDPAEAEEIAQEAFVRAYERWESLREPEAFVGWLGTIVARMATDRLRRQRRQQPPSLPIEEKPRDPIDANETARALWQEVRNLQPDYRTAFLLVYLDDVSYGEAANQLGVPVSTIEGRVYMAKRILREKLK